MPHLLLDLAQSPTPKRKIPYHRAKVGLFVTLKAAKRMLAPEEPHSLYVLPNKKAARSIAQAAADILQHQPQAQIAIVSPRKKLRPYLHQLQIKYPQARLLHKKKLGKAVRRFLKQARQPENPFGEAPSEQRLIEHTAQTVQQAVAQIIPSAPAGAESALIATALALLKKTIPRKNKTSCACSPNAATLNLHKKCLPNCKAQAKSTLMPPKTCAIAKPHGACPPKAA